IDYFPNSVRAAFSIRPLLTQSGHAIGTVIEPSEQLLRPNLRVTNPNTKVKLSEGDRAAMKRRDFISLLGGAAAWPLATRAQQSERMRRVGVLMAHKEGDPEFQDYLGAFRQGLLKLGWVEGRNVRIDARWGALDDADQRQRSAKELLALQPD